MGGVKRKIPIEKIEKKDPRAVTFSKRRKGLYSKASELCLLSDAQIAIIATPLSSNSNASFYTFGHSSVDSVVAAFLANQRPREDERLGFWWEDESLADSENPVELKDGIDSMLKMLQDLKELEKRRDSEDVNKEKSVSHGTHLKQTLNPQPCSATSVCIQDDVTVNYKNTEEQTLAFSDNGLLGSFDGCNQELDLDQIFGSVTKSEDLWNNLEMDDGSMVTTNQNLFSVSDSVVDGDLVTHKDLNDNSIHLSDLDENQILAISDNNNNNVLSGNLSWFNQELDLDQIIDFETNSENLLMNFEMDDVSMETM